MNNEDMIQLARASIDQMRLDEITNLVFILNSFQFKDKSSLKQEIVDMQRQFNALNNRMSEIKLDVKLQIFGFNWMKGDRWDSLNEIEKIQQVRPYNPMFGLREIRTLVKQETDWEARADSFEVG